MNMKIHDSKTMQQYFDEQRKMTASLPEDIRALGPYLNRYRRTRKNFTLFPKFCSHILDKYPGFSYIFIDRDARPLYLTMDVFRNEKALDMESRIIAFTTKMMPDKLRSATDKMMLRSDSALSIFNAIEMKIHCFVSRHRADDTYLHRYLHQELDDLDKLLFIDTGYWGRCISYLCNLFDDKKTDYVLLRGPEQSRCFSLSDLGGESVNSFENQLNHGFDIVGLADEDGKIVIKTEKEQYYHEYNLHLADYFAVEANAYEHIGLLTADKEHELMKKWAGKVAAEAPAEE